MARGFLDNVRVQLKNIASLNGTVRTVSIAVQSNGKEDRENPAYYVDRNDREGKYPFSEPALVDFNRKVMESSQVSRYFDNMLASGKKRRSQKDMDEASRIMGKLAYREVMNYLWYEMPQKEQWWKTGYNSWKRNLYDSGDLFRAIYWKVDKHGEEIARGR